MHKRRGDVESHGRRRREAYPPRTSETLRGTVPRKFPFPEPRGLLAGRWPTRGRGEFSRPLTCPVLDVCRFRTTASGSHLFPSTSVSGCFRVTRATVVGVRAIIASGNNVVKRTASVVSAWDLRPKGRDGEVALTALRLRPARRTPLCRLHKAVFRSDREQQ